MLFASFSYLLVFLPIVVTGCILLRRFAGPRAAQFWVLAASIVFYTRVQPFNVVYLAGSVVANWTVARWIDRSQGAARTRALTCGLVLNVLYLGIFKYLAFFASMLHFLLPRGLSIPDLPFPLGVSFFTITQIVFLMDCYEEVLPAGSFFDHATFVSFFPYVISGPLSRAKRMRHQFDRFGGIDGQRTAALSRGLFHFAMGLFKKAVLADSFSRVATYGYNSAHNMSAVEAWVFSIAYAMRLYFDFSGYSDMAIGSAIMLGIEIPRNFDAPFRSKSITEFWERWHITLTDLITTFLYTPMLRSFARKRFMARNMLFAASLATILSMSIAGLWHGGAWTFVIFGLLHGIFLATKQIWRKKRMPRIAPFFSWLITFGAVVISLIYFGASTVGQANARVVALFNPHHALFLDNIGEMSIEGISLRIFGLPLLIGLVVAFVGASSEQRARDFRPTLRNSFVTVLLFAVAFVFVNSNIPTPFVYFRF